jgi:hypothetical protein
VRTKRTYSHRKRSNYCADKCYFSTKFHIAIISKTL